MLGSRESAHGHAIADIEATLDAEARSRKGKPVDDCCTQAIQNERQRLIQLAKQIAEDLEASAIRHGAARKGDQQLKNLHAFAALFAEEAAR